MTARDSVISLREGGSFRIEALQVAIGRTVDLGNGRQGHVYQGQSIFLLASYADLAPTTCPITLGAA
jgi:hypothetical protein